jgi:protein TonB
MVYQFVEVMPEYSGGEEKLRKFITDNLVYPKEAKEKGIKGTVYLKFIVEKDGSISDVEVVRGIGGGCDEEAIRIIKMMPKWKPGNQGGESVAVKFTIPVKFILP